MGFAENHAGMKPEDYAAMGGVKLDGTPLPPPMTTVEKAIHDATAKNIAKTAGHPPIEEKGFIRSLWDDMTGGGESAELAVTRLAIKAMTPNQMLDRIAQADPNNKELQTFTKLAKADPKFATALKTSIDQDPSMLPGLLGMKDGKGAFTMASLNEAMKNDYQRGIMTQVLEKIGEKPDDKWNFKTLDTLAKYRENNELAKASVLLQEMGINSISFDPQAFLQFFMDIVEGKGATYALNNLANSMGLEGEQKAALGRLGKIIAAPMDLIVGGTNAPGGFVYTHGDTMKNFAKGIMADVETLSKDPSAFQTEAKQTGQKHTDIPKGEHATKFSDSVSNTVEGIKKAALEGVNNITQEQTQTASVKSFTPVG